MKYFARLFLPLLALLPEAVLADVTPISIPPQVVARPKKLNLNYGDVYGAVRFEIEKFDAPSQKAWLKALAPSTPLRKWFNHDPARWETFRTRYFEELEAKPEALAQLRAYLARGPVTLLYGARDEEHNNAVALRDFVLHGRSHRSHPA